MTDRKFDHMKEVVAELSYAVGKSHPEYTKQYRKLRTEQLRRNRKTERDVLDMKAVINGKGWTR